MLEFLQPKKPADDAPPSAPTPQPAAETLDTSAGNPASAAGAAARANAEQQLDLSPRRRRSTRGAATRGGAGERALQEEVNAVLVKQLDQLHDPKAWGALLGAPADVAQALTGREHWQLSEKERDTLGACGSAAARVMMVTNPKALAFAMLGSALTMVYLPRLIKEARAMRAEKAAQQQKPAQ